MTNVLAINQPEGLQPLEISKKELECHDYVYAGYLPAGRHQFLIYSPRARRAFFKELVVDLNYAEIYRSGSGYTKKKKASQKAKAPNVWTPWLEDTDEKRH